MAVVGPLSPQKTGVASFSEHLIPYLADRCEIGLFTDSPSVSPASPIWAKYRPASVSELHLEASGFDAILYHMGNHCRYHRSVFEALWRIPGIVMLHDCVLNQFFAKYALERGNFGVFQRLFRSCYGDSGDAEAIRFMKGRGDPYEFPMAGVVARRSRGTIVMTEYGAGIVRREAPGARILKTNFPYFQQEDGPERSGGAIGGLELAPDRFVVAVFGHMTRAKRIDVAIEAFARFARQFPRAVLLLAGEESPSFPVRRIVARRASRNIHYLGYLENDDVARLLARADVFINLRYPSNGEMSASLMRMLGRGNSVVVSNYAQFAEFPDSTCVKIDLGPNEIDDLAGELLALARDEDRRMRIGEAAKEHIERRHGPEDVADAIIEFARENSATEPLLSAEETEGLLRSDNISARYPRMAVYNARRFFRRAGEQGVLAAARQAFGRA